MKFREEKDSMGKLNVPENALYGATTQRALLNFPISDLRFNRTFIKSIAEIKRCAAETNLELGTLEENIAEEIIKAAEMVSSGDFDNEFVILFFCFHQ